MTMKEIDHFLKKEIETNKAPSVQYVIFNTDSIIHKCSFGFSDIKTQSKATENTTYYAYSATKTFTALAILQLVLQRDFHYYETFDFFGFERHF